jgi:lysophospholipid acyltransferase (LPLAT)-like uncharacterized protein
MWRRLKRWITHSEWFTDLVASLAVLFILGYVKTLRIRLLFHPDFSKIDRRKACYGFWHGRQFLLVRKFEGVQISIMTDLSWAGSIQAKILKRFGYIPVRGSSSRGGTRALVGMKAAIEKGCAGAFAMDGPSGPIHKSKPGILYLAAKLGYPIVPMATSASRAWVLEKTWCKYLLPKPFSTCCIAVGKPLWSASGEDRLTPERLDRALVEWTEETDRMVTEQLSRAAV